MTTAADVTEADLEYVHVAMMLIEQHVPFDSTKERTTDALREFLIRHGWDFTDRPIPEESDEDAARRDRRA